MPVRRINVQKPTAAPAVEQSAELAARFDAVRAELKVPEAFPADVGAEAKSAAASAALPDRDETAVAFLTIDPPGSMDLDQALHIERQTAPGQHGYRVRYAIADVAAFVTPGDQVDVEAHVRGETLY